MNFHLAARTGKNPCPNCGRGDETEVDGIAKEEIAASLEHFLVNSKTLCILCWLQTWKILEGLVLAVTLCSQSSLLNYYIIYYSRGTVGWYFLFLIDVMVIILFVIAIIMARRHYSSWNKQQQTGDTAISSINMNGHTQCTYSEPGQIFGAKLPQSMGVLPLSYISWFIYSIVLVFKIFVFFANDILIKMVSGEDTTLYGSKLFEVSLALTALIFLLWIEAHKNLEDDLHRSWSKTLTDELIQHTTFEIFDLIFFLELITPDIDPVTKHVINTPNVGRPLMYTIVALGALNVVYPSLGIYQLSKLHKSSQVEETAIRSHPEKHIYGTNVFIHFIRLVNVNIPYLFIRIHLASAYDRTLSIFIVKNFLGIIVSSRSLFIEYFRWRGHSKAKAKAKKNKKMVELSPKVNWDIPRAPGPLLNSVLQSTPKPYKGECSSSSDEQDDSITITSDTKTSNELR
ncbi:uncharacterized protein LOC107368828 [Tetranychus urticae]|uniref:Uncharacterized protein n=1 Tax=Tetranychus urticae TaxID=32264 RepID=T1KZB7_TETUR|nr:uncharacterized protein LOC107368828 [Tetranychus urticae]